MSNYELVLREMIERLARFNFAIISRRTGAEFNVEDETLEVPFFGQLYKVSKKDCRAVSGTSADTKDLILIIDYLISFGGLDAGGEWIDFRDLPGSMPYDGAFRVNVETALEFRASEIIEHGGELIDRLAGFRVGGYEQYDYAAAFQVFPRVECLVLLCEGDDEIGPGAKVLFSSNAHNFMTTESLAAIAESLTGKLVKSS